MSCEHSCVAVVDGRRTGNSKRWAPIGLAVGIGIVACGVTAAVVLDRTFPSCDWSPEEIAQVEGVPLRDFVGSPAGEWSASCDSSTPEVLYIVDHLPKGTSLPDGWFERDRVDSWTAQWRAETPPKGPLVCYRSTDARYPDVQVRLWANGSVEASILAGTPPCDERPG